MMFQCVICFNYSDTDIYKKKYKIIYIQCGKESKLKYFG